MLDSYLMLRVSSQEVFHRLPKNLLLLRFRLSHKLAVRRFLTTTSLLSNELQGVCVSLKEEFMLSDGIHYGSYYRFYLRPSTPSMVPLSHLIEYMQKRKKVRHLSNLVLLFPHSHRVLGWIRIFMQKTYMQNPVGFSCRSLQSLFPWTIRQCSCSLTANSPQL